MTIYLVRHAKAGDRSAWPGDDFLRPLSRRGQIQARGARRAVRGLPHRPPALEPVRPLHGDRRAARRRRRMLDRAVERAHRGREPRRCARRSCASTRITTRSCAGTATSSRCCSSTTRPRCRPRHGSGVAEGLTGSLETDGTRMSSPRSTSRHRRSRPEELRRAHAGAAGPRPRGRSDTLFVDRLRGSAGSSCGPWMSSEPELARDSRR